MSNSAAVEKHSDELCVSEVYSLLPMAILLLALLLEAAELATLGTCTCTGGAEDAAIGDNRPCRLLGRWFSMSCCRREKRMELDSNSSIPTDRATKK